MSRCTQNVDRGTNAFDHAAWCGPWNEPVAACSNISQLSIAMTHASPTPATKRLSKQKPLVEDWAVMTQQTYLYGIP